MTMQLFSFGHPCEHQLRRTCIGGTSCPLNGYPDNWCCSFIKGKINFKRDKPCEGTRCRWGFTHPSQSQFDAVTLVLNESRPIATKIDDAEDKDLLSFSIDNSHVVDTVQCALHMMRHPPSSCTTRVGQLLAYAAVRTGDSKVFMQLLKTMKKPFDGYLLGAYDYLTSGHAASTTTASASAAGTATTTTTTTGSAANSVTTTGGEKNSKSLAKRSSCCGGGGVGGASGNGEKKESAVDELRNGMVDLMNAALSSGGQLVNREDQHTLQVIFIQALRGYPKGNKRRQEMLEAAIAKFGSRLAAKSATPSASGIAAASAAHAAAAAAASTSANSNSNSPAVATATAANSATNGSVAGARAEPQRSTESPGATAEEAAASHTPRSRENSAAGTARGGRAQGTTAAAAPNAKPKETVTAVASAPASAAAAVHSISNTTPVGNNSASANASAAVPANRTTAVATAPVPVKQAPIVGISRVARVQSGSGTRHYDPIRTDKPLPNVLLFGGLFGLTQRSAASSLLGNASSRAPPANVAAAAAAPLPSTGSSSAAETNCNTINDKVFHILHSPELEYKSFLDVEEQQLFRGIYEE